MKRSFFYLACALVLVACNPEENEPVDLGQNLSGIYALDDGSGLSDKFVEFVDKNLTLYAIEAAPTFAEGNFWHCKKTDFSVKGTAEYTHIDNQLKAGNLLNGEAVFTSSGFSLGKETYTKVSGFKEEYYSSISLEASELTVSSEEASHKFVASVSKPIPAGALAAKSDAEWITGVKVSDGSVQYSVSETKIERTGTITLSYTNAEDALVTIKQSAPTCIILPKTGDSVSYEAGEYSFDCSVQSPVSGITLSVECKADWVSGINVQEDKITLNLAENASVNPRTCQLVLLYGSYSSAEFTLTQQAMPVQSITLDKTSLDMIIGQQETLTATIMPADANCEWESSDVNVATVKDGQVSAISSGTATITVKADDKSASCVVNVKFTPAFSISESHMLFSSPGGSKTLTITSDSDCNFTAESSNEGVASASVSGKTVTITANAYGTATISVNCPETQKYSSAESLTCKVSVVEPEDLSAAGKANCYIVNKPGCFTFDCTVKGNSTESVGAVASAEVLWESFGTIYDINVGDIIQSVSYKDGHVQFTTPSELRNGNAVIAVKNASGNILWSWHIWVCEGFDPLAAAQVYYNNAGTMMDRNLGATNVEPGNLDILGLLYQWGRKDPFLASGLPTIYEEAASTISWPEAVYSDASTGTIAYTVAHPTTYIEYTTSGDWYYSESANQTDNTRWKSSKTIYDPCPAGWRVPDGGENGVWAKALGSSSCFNYFEMWDPYRKIINLSGKLGEGKIWYPFAGIMVKPGVLNTGIQFCNWSCTPSSIEYEETRAYVFGTSDQYIGDPANREPRSFGIAVRCQKQ